MIEIQVDYAELENEADAVRAALAYKPTTAEIEYTKLLSRLMYVDWSYEYSDDASVWRRGKAAVASAQQLIADNVDRYPLMRELQECSYMDISGKVYQAWACTSEGILSTKHFSVARSLADGSVTMEQVTRAVEFVQSVVRLIESYPFRTKNDTWFVPTPKAPKNKAQVLEVCGGYYEWLCPPPAVEQSLYFLTKLVDRDLLRALGAVARGKLLKEVSVHFNNIVLSDPGKSTRQFNIVRIWPRDLPGWSLFV